MTVTDMARADFLRTLEAQNAKGMATYGQPLTLAVDINPFQYALDELVDAVQYLTYAKQENILLAQALSEAAEILRGVEYNRKDLGNSGRAGAWLKRYAATMEPTLE